MSFFNGDMKSSEISVEGATGLVLKDLEGAATIPSSGYGALYVNADVLYFKTDGGTATNLLSGGGGGGGVSLTGSTDNTVCTVTGTDTIAGESNLTFNGSHLTIKGGVSFPKLTTDSDSTSSYTYTASNMIGGIINREPSTSATDTVPSATNIVSAIPNAVVGSSFRFFVVNKGSSIILQKVGIGSGITFVDGASSDPSTLSLFMNSISEFLVLCTNVTSAAVTIYKL